VWRATQNRLPLFFFTLALLKGRAPAQLPFLYRHTVGFMECQCSDHRRLGISFFFFSPESGSNQWRRGPSGCVCFLFVTASNRHRPLPFPLAFETGGYQRGSQSSVPSQSIIRLSEPSGFSFGRAWRTLLLSVADARYRSISGPAVVFFFFPIAPTCALAKPKPASPLSLPLHLIRCRKRPTDRPLSD